jgi:hypothetical protein
MPQNKCIDQLQLAISSVTKLPMKYFSIFPTESLMNKKKKIIGDSIESLVFFLVM